jgi:tetratricopeptide (TPR) repeat protein
MALKPTIIAAACAALLSGLAAQSVRHGAAPASPVAVDPSAETKSGYAVMLDDVDARIDSLQARAAERPDDWLLRMHLGTAMLDRAGLTHDVADYDRLQHVLDEAFTIAPHGSGPLLLAARFNFSIHRLAVAEDYLDRMDRRALQKGDEVVAASILRAQIAFQRGEHEKARAGLEEVAEVVPAAASAELALYHAKTGAPERADALLADALAQTSPRDARRRAWILLQRGLVAMDRGAYLHALEHMQDADAELSGWWLVQEHVAEVHGRLGHHGKALAILEELVRAHEMPQHMDALALARRHAGQDIGDLVERAGGRWADWFARWPEAAMGHGLEHELQFGEPVRAVELAEANHAARPGGDAKVALARAYLVAKRPADALAQARIALATPYRTVALHRVAADAHAALGETAAAAEELARCVAINPSCEAQQHSH